MPKKPVSTRSTAVDTAVDTAAPSKPALVPAEDILSGKDGLTLEEQEVQALARAEKFLSTYELVEKSSNLGRWVGMPAEYVERGYHWVRAGLRGNPRDEALARDLINKGYILAPAGVRPIGFESDGTRGIYLGGSPRVGKMMLALRARAAAFRRAQLERKLLSNAKDQLREIVGKHGDVDVSISVGTGNQDKFTNELAAVQRAAS